MLSEVLVQIVVSFRQVVSDWRNADLLRLSVKPRLQIGLDFDEAFAALGVLIKAETQVRPGFGGFKLSQIRRTGLVGVLIDECDVRGLPADFQRMGHTRFGKFMEPLAFGKTKRPDHGFIVEAFEEDHGSSGRKRSRLKKALMSISMSSIRWSSFMG